MKKKTQHCKILHPRLVFRKLFRAQKAAIFSRTGYEYGYVTLDKSLNFPKVQHFYI